ncbi:MAG: S41 family peptidase [Lachnospiraceae bacterium]|nr:S41 family peptidase [Lachnospiraceae bacterium]
MKQRSQFKSGFFSGVGATLAALMLALVVTMLVSAGKQYGVIDNDTKPASVDEQGGIASAVNKKLKEMQDYVDYYYIFDYSEDEVVDKMLKAYVDGLGDKYSAYYTKDEMADITESMTGEYYGIGVSVTQVEEGALIMQVFDDSPAMEAGLQSGDIIIGVGDTVLAGMDLDNIVTLIRGAEGESVTLTYSRNGAATTIECDRRKVQTQTVSYKMIEGTNVGYIELTQFEDVSVSQMRKAIQKLTDQGMEKLILDIRSNPGGLLTSVIDIADMFLDKGQYILHTRSKQGLERNYASENAPIYTGELLLLVNEYSASASEVLASSLQDNGRAKLVGTTTFGKGIVQTYFSLSDGTTLKITTENYFTADWHDIHGKGIDPDYAVELDADKEGDEQLDKALELFGSGN